MPQTHLVLDCSRAEPVMSGTTFDPDDLLIRADFSEAVARAWLEMMAQARFRGVDEAIPAEGIFRVFPISKSEAQTKLPELFANQAFLGTDGLGVAVVTESLARNLTPLASHEVNHVAYQGGGEVVILGQGVGPHSVHWDSVTLTRSDIFRYMLAAARGERVREIALEAARYEGTVVATLLDEQVFRFGSEGYQAVEPPTFDAADRSRLLTSESRGLRETLILDPEGPGEGRSR